jgi:transcriptional regulator with XRE-family HTH domain
MIERIKKLRKSKGLSQSELARTIGVNQTQYNRYETGKTKVPVDVLLRIAQELDTTVDYLLTGMAIEKSPKGFFENDVFAKLYEVLRSAKLEEYSVEELAMLEGVAKLIIEKVEQVKMRRKKK